MDENLYQVLVLIVVIPTVLSLIVGLANYLSMKIMLIKDKQIKGWDKWPALLMGMEVEYARDIVGANPNSKYAKSLKRAKACGIIFTIRDGRVRIDEPRKRHLLTQRRDDRN